MKLDQLKVPLVEYLNVNWPYCWWKNCQSKSMLPWYLRTEHFWKLIVLSKEYQKDSDHKERRKSKASKNQTSSGPKALVALSTKSQLKRSWLYSQYTKMPNKIYYSFPSFTLLPSHDTISPVLLWILYGKQVVYKESRRKMKEHCTIEIVAHP